MTTDQVRPKFGWDAWARWDALHFLSIAESGYGPEVVGGNAPAFFPLFPLAVRVVSAAGIEPLHAGILVSFVSTFVASAYLYRLAQLHGFDGDRSIVYLLLFPTGVFLVAPYTEALFLACAVPAFYYAQERAWPAALFTAIAVGTRTVGLFVLLGVAVELAHVGAWPHWRRLAWAVVAPDGGLAAILALRPLPATRERIVLDLHAGAEGGLGSRLHGLYRRVLWRRTPGPATTGPTSCSRGGWRSSSRPSRWR